MDKFKAWWASKDKKARRRITIIGVVAAIILFALISSANDNDSRRPNATVLHETAHIA